MFNPVDLFEQMDAAMIEVAEILSRNSKMQYVPFDKKKFREVSAALRGGKYETFVDIAFKYTTPVALFNSKKDADAFKVDFNTSLKQVNSKKNTTTMPTVDVLFHQELDSAAVANALKTQLCGEKKIKRGTVLRFAELPKPLLFRTSNILFFSTECASAFAWLNRAVCPLCKSVGHTKAQCTLSKDELTWLRRLREVNETSNLTNSGKKKKIENKKSEEKQTLPPTPSIPLNPVVIKIVVVPTTTIPSTSAPKSPPTPPLKDNIKPSLVEKKLPVPQKSPFKSPLSKLPQKKDLKDLERKSTVPKPSSLKAKKPSSQDKYDVEDIIGHRITKGLDEYLVKWLGYPSTENTWEPIVNIDPGSLHLIRKFQKHK